MLRQATPEEKAQIMKYLNQEDEALEDAMRADDNPLMMYDPAGESSFAIPHPSLDVQVQLLAPIREQLQKTLCEEWALCDKVNTQTLDDKLNLIVTIADVITMAVTALPIPATLIAATIVKMGARRFCECGEG